VISGSGLAVAAAVLVGLSLLTFLAWPSSDRRARRGKARAIKAAAVDYRKERQNPLGDGRPVTVAELVERMAREDRTALNRPQRRFGEDSHPTDMLPRVE
jgi:hypothetical protein